jgi:hypothetical protein
MVLLTRKFFFVVGYNISIIVIITDTIRPGHTRFLEILHNFWNTHLNMFLYKYNLTRFTITHYLTKLPMKFSTSKMANHTRTNEIEGPEINPHSYSHLILTKEPKHKLKKRQPLQQMFLGKLNIHL